MNFFFNLISVELKVVFKFFLYIFIDPYPVIQYAKLITEKENIYEQLEKLQNENKDLKRKLKKQG